MEIETLITGFIILWAILFPIGIYRAYTKYRSSKFTEPKPEAKEEKTKKIRPFVRSARWMGWMFLFVGSIMAISEIPSFFSDGGVVIVNGEPRDELWIKISTSMFILFFPIFGGFLAFTPKRKIESCLLRFQILSERFAVITKR